MTDRMQAEVEIEVDGDELELELELTRSNTPPQPDSHHPKRDLLGGNGILLDFHVIRHMVDIEAIHTFEGTETIQTLIVGRDITSVGAFT